MRMIPTNPNKPRLTPETFSLLTLPLDDSDKISSYNDHRRTKNSGDSFENENRYQRLLIGVEPDADKADNDCAK